MVRTEGNSMTFLEGGEGQIFLNSSAIRMKTISIFGKIN